MLDLSRTVRFCVSGDQDRGADIAREAQHNSFAGWPSMKGLGAYYELVVTCRGQAHQATGYLMNISVIDQAVRQHAIPLITAAFQGTPSREPAPVLAEVCNALRPALRPALLGVRWRLTPYYSVAMNEQARDRFELRQRFEFCASHRLHVPTLSDEENRRVFGKCNNPNSHGHNYWIEPVVSVPLLTAADTEVGLTLGALERIVDEVILQRFDHKHLNLDTVEFSALNPSVENIAKVCYDLLRGRVEQVGARLEHVTVWETEKTCCSYPAAGGPANGEKAPS